MESHTIEELSVKIRRIGVDDHINIIKLFQSFDKEKYSFMTADEFQNNNTSKTSLSLAGLRIDERGGIYLTPLLDSNSAYFKCYVCEDMTSGQLIGYILFFNTLDERGATYSGLDDPLAVVEDLYVKPNFRRRGIGTQLWRKVLQSSLDRGCFSCECLLIPDSEEGVKFFERQLGRQKVQEVLCQQKNREQEVFLEISRTQMTELLQSD